MTDFRALCAELHEALEKRCETLEEDRLLDKSAAALRAALAQPEPQGVTDEEAVALYSEVMVFHECQTLGDMAGHFARAVLARWGHPAIKPVPMSKRLPGPEDCDVEGQVWGWYRDGRLGFWQIRIINKSPKSAWLPTHWLPHHALPVPQQEGNRG
jgi:hypothetical protein